MTRENLGENLDTIELSVRQLVWVVHLTEQHAKAPHVCGWRELSVVQALRSHPSYWPGKAELALLIMSGLQLYIFGIAYR